MEMITNSYRNRRFMARFVLVPATALLLSISLMQSLQPTNAIQLVDQFPLSITSHAAYTNLGGDLRGSIQGLLSDLTDLAGSTGEQLTGKIASSAINLNNGTVEKVLLGNWSLDSQQGGRPMLLVDFDVLNNINGIPTRQVANENFMIGNLTVSSMQQNDGNTEIGGSVDITQFQGNQQQRVWSDVGARLLLTNGAFLLTLDENSAPGQIFARNPIVGFTTQ
jgi:hypothetical protein